MKEISDHFLRKSYKRELVMLCLLVKFLYNGCHQKVYWKGTLLENEYSKNFFQVKAFLLQTGEV